MNPHKLQPNHTTNGHIMRIARAISRQQGDYGSETGLKETEIDSGDFDKYISEYWEELPGEIQEWLLNFQAEDFEKPELLLPRSYTPPKYEKPQHPP
jgi:hypothetical protein